MEDTKSERKSLAVDVETYDMLQQICNAEDRNKINTLKRLIRDEHKRLDLYPVHYASGVPIGRDKISD
jgi:hypothetical protein|tara:strand:+ start:734 stop:937 length:204 start_codon:yes stop_codon:yes gene_type:complete